MKNTVCVFCVFLNRIPTASATTCATNVALAVGVSEKRVLDCTVVCVYARSND